MTSACYIAWLSGNAMHSLHSGVENRRVYLGWVTWKMRWVTLAENHRQYQYALYSVRQGGEQFNASLKGVRLIENSSFSFFFFFFLHSDWGRTCIEHDFFFSPCIMDAASIFNNCILKLQVLWHLYSFIFKLNYWKVTGIMGRVNWNYQLKTQILNTGHRPTAL